MIKRIVLCFLVFNHFSSLFSQGTAEEIINKGVLLYKLEKASWISTEIFLKKSNESERRIGGFLSFPEGNGYKTIFYSPDDPFLIMASVKYDSIILPPLGQFSSVKRRATPLEMDLIKLRQDVSTAINLNADKFYTTVTGTNLNIVPIISGERREVYVVTAINSGEYIVFGNDYYHSYGNNLKLISRRKLHPQPMPVSSNLKVEKGDREITMHKHIEGYPELITETDICTLLLYGGYSNWKQHVVIGEDFISVWDLQAEKLAVIPKSSIGK